MFLIVIAFFAFAQTPVFSQETGKMELSKHEVKIPCPPGFRQWEGSECGKDLTIAVTTSIKNFKEDEITFDYKVSGGQIVGNGSKVFWNLANTQPGTYTIYADIKDKSGANLGKTNTNIITVEDCGCIIDLDCVSDILIMGPRKPIRAGELVTFTASLEGGWGENNFDWKVSKGEIIQGQNTSSIKIKTTPEMANQKITINLTVTDKEFDLCLLEESVTVKIEKEISAMDVESLTLDKDFAVIGCNPENFPRDMDSSCFDENELLITAKTKISETQKDEDLKYYYTVSGGEIMGTGAEVIWNLRGEREGKYTITVGVGKDFIISGKTLTRTIELVECTCHRICECLTDVKILGPSKPIKADSLVIFKAETVGKLKSPVYKWSISNGKILKGQGKSQILVRTNSSENNLEVKVEVSETDWGCTECDITTTSKSFQLIQN